VGAPVGLRGRVRAGRRRGRLRRRVAARRPARPRDEPGDEVDPGPPGRGAVVRYRMPAAVREHGLDRLRASGDDESCRRRHRDRYQRLVLESRAGWPGPRQDECPRAARPRRRGPARSRRERRGRAGRRRPGAGLLTAVPVGFWQLRACCRRAGTGWRPRWSWPPPRRRCARGRSPPPVRWRSARATRGGRAVAAARRACSRSAWAPSRSSPGPRTCSAWRALAGGDLGRRRRARSAARSELLDLRPPRPELRLTLLAATAATVGGARRRRGAAPRRDCRPAACSRTRRPLPPARSAGRVRARRVAAARPRRRRRQAADEPAPGPPPRRGDAAAAWDLPVCGSTWRSWPGPPRGGSGTGAPRPCWRAEDLGGGAHEALALLRHLGRRPRAVRPPAPGRPSGTTPTRRARRRGRGLDADEAVELALGPDQEHREQHAAARRPGTSSGTSSRSVPSSVPSSGSARSSGPAPGPAPLTRRELQVAELVAGGRSNREIAAALVISQRTAEAHVGNIPHEARFATRAQIAALGGRPAPRRLTSRHSEPREPEPGEPGEPGRRHARGG
jgi:DNA-binding CsgD family transcriptional regulator